MANASQSQSESDGGGNEPRRVLEFYSGIGGMVTPPKPIILYSPFTYSSLVLVQMALCFVFCLEVLADASKGERASGGSIRNKRQSK